MARATKKELESAFKRFCQAVGKRQATAWNDVGAWKLDYASCYGGYVVCEVIRGSGEGIGETCPLGYRRRTATELVEFLWFAVDVIGERERVLVALGVDLKRCRFCGNNALYCICSKEGEDE